MAFAATERQAQELEKKREKKRATSTASALGFDWRSNQPVERTGAARNHEALPLQGKGLYGSLISQEVLPGLGTLP
jgi:hypothetical protein